MFSFPRSLFRGEMAVPTSEGGAGVGVCFSASATEDGRTTAGVVDVQGQQKMESGMLTQQWRVGALAHSLPQDGGSGGDGVGVCLGLGEGVRGGATSPARASQPVGLPQPTAVNLA